MNMFLRFCYAFAAVAVTALISAYFVESGMLWYTTELNLPPLTPPNRIFAPVWSALYVLMIWSFFRVLDGTDIFRVRQATMLFLGQLVLHVLWCRLFFYSGNVVWGFIVLVLMLGTVFMMIRQFAQIDRTAAYLQYPYFVWLLFALYLNLGVMWLNPA